MYFSKFIKNSPGFKLYGYGFVLNHKNHTFIFGIKFKKRKLNFLRFHTKNQKLYMFRLGFCVITFGYRNTKKDFKSFAGKTWKSKKRFISLHSKENEINDK